MNRLAIGAVGSAVHILRYINIIPDFEKSQTKLGLFHGGMALDLKRLEEWKHGGQSAGSVHPTVLG
ncbi:MAG: hypothetical protein OXN17_18330 [Candidatus Poribacteria bacterium]|nr:hypothetical protein [Candidatus Poribacteria bacterium]MDE0502675.1 hypothetical protein [Candidatus Poribacteria bacterium]